MKDRPKAKASMSVQKDGKWMKPIFDEDKEAFKLYPQNTLMRITVSWSPKKQRSIPQHGLFRKCLDVVADHCSETYEGDPVGTDPEWDKPNKVLTQVCMAIGWYKKICVLPDGTVMFERKSTSFEAMEHPDACNVYSHAMDLMAEKIGYTLEQLIGEAKDRMG
jgi:hypothetical protein